MTVYQSMQALFMLSRESSLICDKVQINPEVKHSYLTPTAYQTEFTLAYLLFCQPESQISLDLIVVILWACSVC